MELQESIQQRSMTHVWKCKSAYYGVEVEQYVITPPHPTKKYQDAKISTRPWPLSGVDTKNKYCWDRIYYTILDVLLIYCIKKTT